MRNEHVIMFVSFISSCTSVADVQVQTRPISPTVTIETTRDEAHEILVSPEGIISQRL